MKVKKLIKELSKLDEDLEVEFRVPYENSLYSISDVEVEYESLTIKTVVLK